MLLESRLYWSSGCQKLNLTLFILWSKVLNIRQTLTSTHYWVEIYASQWCPFSCSIPIITEKGRGSIFSDKSRHWRLRQHCLDIMSPRLFTVCSAMTCSVYFNTNLPTLVAVLAEEVETRFNGKVQPKMECLALATQIKTMASHVVPALFYRAVRTNGSNFHLPCLLHLVPLKRFCTPWRALPARSPQTPALLPGYVIECYMRVWNSIMLSDNVLASQKYAILSCF